jgi:hypothetical protein
MTGAEIASDQRSASQAGHYRARAGAASQRARYGWTGAPASA